MLSHILHGQPDEEEVSTRCTCSPSRVFERFRHNPNVTVYGQDGRVVIAPPPIRRTNYFLLLPAITKILGTILGFACTTDAELMRLRTVSMQFYYLPFQMPYGLNALRGMTDLLAGLTLKPQSAKQMEQGTGDEDLFKTICSQSLATTVPTSASIRQLLKRTTSTGDHQQIAQGTVQYLGGTDERDKQGDLHHTGLFGDDWHGCRRHTSADTGGSLSQYGLYVAGPTVHSPQGAKQYPERQLGYKPRIKT